MIYSVGTPGLSLSFNASSELDVKSSCGILLNKALTSKLTTGKLFESFPLLLFS